MFSPLFLFFGLLLVIANAEILPAIIKKPSTLLHGPTRAIPAGSCGVSKYGTPKTLSFNLPNNPKSLNMSRIVGGTEAKPNAWPWQVYIFAFQQGSDYGIACGGSIYNENYIITAAHCFYKQNVDSAAVFAGKHDISVEPESTEQLVWVQTVSIHERYVDAVYGNDIAVLKLHNSLVFNENVQPICMPDTVLGSLAGETLTVTGWGRIVPGGADAKKLQQLDVKALSNTECQQKWSAHGVSSIKDGMICAMYGQTMHSACQGDSGGPLHYLDKAKGRYVQVGIVSFGDKDCSQSIADIPTVYTRLEAYLDWVNQKTGTSAATTTTTTTPKPPSPTTSAAAVQIASYLLVSTTLLFSKA